MVVLEMITCGDHQPCIYSGKASRQFALRLIMPQTYSTHMKEKKGIEQYREIWRRERYIYIEREREREKEREK
jgi:hypothetical protein